MAGKRTDSKGRILLTGESQRQDGRYAYKYTNVHGESKFIYSWKLNPTDPIPKGKGYMYDVALYDDHLEITSMQKRKLLLNYDQITDVFYGFETELVEKPKSVIGRAAVGGILFGGVGAIVGAASGTGTKTEKELHRCFIISYTSSDGEDKYMQFEDTRKYKGNKLYKKLKNLAHVESESIPDVQNL